MPTFDVKPKTYSERFGTSHRTAQRYFKQWFLDGKPFIVHPTPGIYRMDREHFDRLLRFSAPTAPTAPKSA
jgi:hypothetical protein